MQDGLHARGGRDAGGVPQMAAQRGHDADHGQKNRHADPGNGKKGHMPGKLGRNHQAQGHPDNRGDGKGRHHQAHRRAPAFFRDDIADDGQDQRPAHAAKSARRRPGGDEQMVGRRQRAKQCPQRETEEEPEQRRLAIKAVEKNPAATPEMPAAMA